MKIFSRVTIGLGLLLGSGIVALADIVPTRNDVDLPYGGIDEVTAPDKAVNTIETFSVDVTGPENQGDFMTAPTVGAYFAGPIANTGVSKDTDLSFGSGPTNAGEKFGISNNVLPVSEDHIASVADIVATPEPSGLPFLGVGAILMGLLVRRKLLRVN
jgi:hypothetical protein